MRQYTFGYLFVRLNKVAAILCIIAGIGCAIFLRWQSSGAADAARYRENDFLRLKLNKLLRVQQTAKRRVLQLKGDTTFPSAYASANQEFSFAIPLATTAHFDRLHTTLDGMDAANKDMKSYVVARFDELVSDIARKLLQHAKAIADEEAPNTPSPPPPKQPEPAGSNEEGLFSEKLGKVEVNERLTALSQARSYLTSLQAVSENPENRRTLGDSVTEIERFASLFSSLTEFAQAPKRSEESPAPTPRAELSAERAAAQLNRVRMAVASAVVSDWAMDSAYEAAVQSYADEAEKCRQAEVTVRRIWQDCVGAIVTALVVSIGCAFVLMVLADITRAILDTAGSTGAVADAYRAAAKSEESES